MNTKIAMAESMVRGSGAELFALPVQNAFLVFNPLLQVSTLVNTRALDLLRQWLCGYVSFGSLPSELADLAILLTEDTSDRTDDTHGPLNPQFLGIIPTRACNAACKYCDFGSGRGKHRTMPLTIADATVTWYADFIRHCGQSLMKVHFFGGEPFVAREVVETVIHRSRALAAGYDLETHFEVSTNGIFEPEYARFVGDFFNAVVLSFDGFKEVHDYHRPISKHHGSFEDVRRSALLLSESPTELCLRCCISTENVTLMEAIADWFCRDFQPSVINFETLTTNPATLAAGLRPPNPYLFAKHCHRAQQIIRKQGIQAVYASASCETLKPSFCPVGQDTLIVSPDGRIGSCYLPQSVWRERGLDMNIGKINSEGKVGIDFDAIVRLRRLVTDKPRCKNCFCKYTCSGGCHVSHTYPDSSLQYEDFCIQTRLLTACNLLDEMEQKEAAESLLSNRNAMKALALQVSDVIKNVT